MLLPLLSASPAWSDQANVFIYHRFNDSRYPSTNISDHEFQAQLEVLEQQRFVVLNLGQVVARMQSGTPLPERCAVITVDDAYRSFLTNGWPLLKRYDFPVTLFVSTDSVGGEDYLSWEELAALQEEGVEIGNHSASHAYLLDRFRGEGDHAWTERVSMDLQRAQVAFGQHLGLVPRLFAYPYGEYDPLLSELVKQLGFVAAFGQQSGVITADQDLYSLPRFPVGGDHTSLEEFRSKLLMKHLQVRVVEPKSPVLAGENPPTLRIYLNTEGLDTGSLRCFVAGSSECSLIGIKGDKGQWEIKARQPLAGRRSKYTLTARGIRDGAWYWFSQLCIQPGLAKMADHAVAR